MPNLANTRIYQDQGGALLTVASGGTINIQASGTLTLDSGASIAVSGYIDVLAGGQIKRAGTQVQARLAHSRFLNVTLAQLNAGATIVAGIVGLSYLVTNFYIVGVGGDAAVSTAIVLQTDEGSPTNIVSGLIAAFASNAVVVGRAKIANVTLGAGFLATLVSGAAINIAKTGGTMTGPTSFNVVVDYLIIG